MYASREPSGEMARRPDQAVLGASASVESIASMDRTTCFAGAGRSQPQIAPAEITIASAITVYHTAFSRPLRSLPLGADAATGGVTDGVCGDTARSTVAVIAGRLKAEARSAISASGSISSSCRTSSWYRRAYFTAPARSPAAARASISFFVAPAESGSELVSLRHQVTLWGWSPAFAELLARTSMTF